MNPLFYDLLRGLRSKGVLILIALTTFLSLTVLFLGLHALPPSGSAADLQDFVVNSMGTIFGFFVPVLGIVAGYETYGRERVTGVLESVLCRPVTRVEVVVARFLALTIAAALAIVLALGLIDAVFYAQTGLTLPAVAFVGLFLALLVEAMAFGGMVFLFSHVFRSTGALQGLSVVSFVVFSIVWYIVIIVSVLPVLFNGGSLNQVISEMVLADYFNPAQYTILVTGYIEHALFFGALPISPGKEGLTLPALVASGALWSTLPFVGACYLAKKRD